MNCQSTAFKDALTVAHHVMVVRIGLVKFQCRKLRIVRAVDALVAEILDELKYSIKAPDHETFQEQFV